MSGIIWQLDPRIIWYMLAAWMVVTVLVFAWHWNTWR